jgi:hypothetical protein
MFSSFLKSNDVMTNRRKKAATMFHVKHRATFALNNIRIIVVFVAKLEGNFTHPSLLYQACFT